MRLMKRVQSALSPSFVMECPSSHGGAIPRHMHRDDDDAGIITRRHSTCVCKFCGRELRNAQALGGHMNVHRREKALAKQLMELHNHSGDERRRNLLEACIEQPEQDVISHACDMHSGSSTSSSSPPSSQSALASSLVIPPWPSLRPKALARRRESVDLELRLGLTPDRL